MENRRLYPRFEANWCTEIHTSQGELQGKTENMSAGGAFIRCSQPLPPGERFQLVLRVPIGSPLHLAAEVVWSRGPDQEGPTGMGVRFVW